MYIPRSVEPIIKSNLFKGMILILYGPRQVGKTTMVKNILKDLSLPAKYINCDELAVQKLLAAAGNSNQLKQIIGNDKIIVIDEAQRITDIGIKLKLLIDNYSEQQIIATGSSSFDLANKIAEPLTGRNFEFRLYPLSITEINPQADYINMKQNLDNLLIYGSYPKVFTASANEEKIKIITHLASNYLYKDVLKFNSLKSATIVDNLLQALALQIGNEVSYTELAQLIGANKETVKNYIEILEQAFVIFKLRPFSRNLRKEIGKLHKVYFYDLGVRNALINNFNPLSLRNDVGQMWENWVVAEKKKQEYWIGNQTNTYFWRTYDQQEIDLIEDKGGHLYGYEIKWRKPKKKAPKAWIETYKDSSWTTITPENYLEIFLKPKA